MQFEHLLNAKGLAWQAHLGDGEIMYRFWKLAVLATIAIGGLASNAQAVTVNDTWGVTSPNEAYIGGTPTSGSYVGEEVIGNYDVFGIHSAVVGRNGDNLEIRINNNYAGQQGTNAALGTQYGALFLGTSSVKYDPTIDNFNDDSDRFQYALDMDYTAGPGDASGNSTLWSLNGDGSDVDQSSAGGIYRSEQAWKPNANAVDSTLDGTWLVEDGDNAPNKNTNGAKSDASSNQDQTGLQQGTGYIDFVVKDFFAVGNPGQNANFLVFAWGMSCANDVILGVVQNPGSLPPVPLPASLILLLSGLLGVGWLGRTRAKQA